MRLTKEDGAVLLGAISTALESTHWKREARAEYRGDFMRNIEPGIRAGEDRVNAELRRVRDKIKAQL